MNSVLKFHSLITKRDTLKCNFMRVFKEGQNSKGVRERETAFEEINVKLPAILVQLTNSSFRKEHFYFKNVFDQL